MDEKTKHGKKNSDPAESKEAIQRAVAERVRIEKEALDDEESQKNPVSESPYFVSNGYWSRSKLGRDGSEISIRLANFTAEIKEENVVDDGKEVTHFFALEGKLKGRHPLPRLEIPATNFNGMSWVSKWGSRPCLEPGQTTKDFVRHAIQKGSNNVKVVNHFAHLGWRDIDGKKVYLHCGGAIGSNDPISVRLPVGLDRYVLPQVGEDADLTQELQASLSFLNIGNRAVTLPLFSLVYLAPLTTLINPLPNFSCYLYGSSGTFKTTLAVLGLSHFGNFTGVEGLSSFDDSIGTLEKRAFTCKDSILVCDDFHPSSNRHSAQLREGTVQRLIRNFSNRTARGRLNSDLTERGRYEPRSMLLITAEDVPVLESTLARVCIIEVTDGAIDKDRMAELQGKAALLPYAMVSYINWIRSHMEYIVGNFPKRFTELRERAYNSGLHKKLPEQVAFLIFALETATSFLQDKKVISESEGKDLVNEGWYIFKILSERQHQRIKDDDPIANFKEIITTLINQHNARIDHTATDGGTIGAGDRIGYYDDNHLYLCPAPTWHALTTYIGKEGGHFPFGKNTFFQMLKNRGVISPGPTGENTILIRANGKPVRVVKTIDPDFYNGAVADFS